MASYALTALLYHGADTRVFRGLRLADNRQVVLKVSTDLQALRAELSILKYLGPSEHWVSGVEISDTEEGTALVLDDDGLSSVSVQASERAVPLEEVLQIGIGAAEALAALHARHILHRDIKPVNVLYSPARDQVRLLDFGSAVQLGAGNWSMPSQGIVGTLAYMPAEQTGRTDADVDGRADVYSLGISLFELISGRLPYQGRDAMEIVSQHLAGPVPKLKSLYSWVPSSVSAVVEKAMAKSPADRYQTARGLAADLRLCLEELRSGGPSNDKTLQLGQYDPPMLQFPTATVGRDDELERISNAVDRATFGYPTLVTIAGDEGLGKRHLVEAALAKLRLKVAIGWGQCEAGPAKPMSGLRNAFNAIADRILGYDELELAKVRSALHTALGGACAVLIDLAPNFERLLGARSPAATLGAVEERARFNFMLVRTLGCLAGEQASILVLRGAEHLDQASISAIEQLLDTPELRVCLVLLCETPVEALSPLAFCTIALRGLPPEHVTSIVATALQLPTSEVGVLSELIYARTLGHLQSVQVFMRTLLDQRVLNYRAGRFEIDIERAFEIDMPPSSTAALVQQVHALEEPAGQVLLALAIAQRATTVETLTGWLDLETEPVTQALANLAIMSLVSLSDDGYQLSSAELANHLQREADPEAARLLHSIIGLSMLQMMTPEEQRDQAYTLLHHLAHGEAPPEADARRRAAELAADVVQDMFATCAFSDALRISEQGLSLLTDLADAEPLRYHLSLTRGTALSCLAQREEADNALATLLTPSSSPQQIAEVVTARMANLAGTDREGQALDICLQGLASVGMHLPRNTSRLRALPRLLLNQSRLRRLDGSLTKLEECQDERARAAIQICASASGIAYLNDPNLFALMTEMAVSWVLRFGLSEWAPQILGAHAIAVNSALKKYREAYALVHRVKEILSSRYGVRQQARSSIVLDFFVGTYFESSSDMRVALQDAHRINLENGDPQQAGYCAMGASELALCEGRPLPEVLELLQQYCLLSEQSGQAVPAGILRTLQLCVAALVEESGEGVLEHAIEQAPPLDRSAPPYIIRSALMIPLLAAGQLDTVSEWADAMRPDYEDRLGSQPTVPMGEVAMGIVAAMRRDSNELKRILSKMRKLDRNLGSGYVSANLALLEAETYRLKNDFVHAMDAYSLAIARAQHAKQLNLLAVSWERSAEMLLANGREAQAKAHYREAYATYRRWGHLRKVGLLEQAMPGIRLSQVDETGAHLALATLSKNTVSTSYTTARIGNASQQLDLHTLLKVSQKTSQQLETSGVVRAVLEGVAENAGAERAVLVTVGEQGLTVHAEVRDGVLTDIKRPLEDYANLPLTLIRISYRSGLAKVFANASNNRSIADDPYIRRTGSRSLAMIPIRFQGKAIGVVVLENNSIEGAFTTERVALVEALAAQAAISLDNASLYEDMEERVALRTAALHARNAEMRSVLDNVDQGLVIADRSGTLSEERSRVLETWFSGRPPRRLADFFVDDERAALAFEIGFEQLNDGLLPMDLCLDQLPQEAKLGVRILAFAYRPLKASEGEFKALLVVISDVTAVRERELLDQAQQQLIAILQRLSADREGTMEFIKETEELVRMIHQGDVQVEVERRLLHTMKGNCAIFGLGQLSKLCHELEDNMQDEDRGLQQQEREELTGSWADFRDKLADIMPHQDKRPLYVEYAQLEQVAHTLLAERHDLAEVVALWKLEPLASRLERVARQAQSLAQRLGKAPIDVEFDDPGFRLNHHGWGDFWSTFVHALRNAIDHGLESPDERDDLAKGAGLLRMGARWHDDRFVFTFADDGRGVAWDKIRQKAEQAGLPFERHDDLVAALFSDGISSRDIAGELSGRGVGMSALADACTAMGGAISVVSTHGEGTEFSFSFPRSVVRIGPMLESTGPAAISA